MPNSVAHSLVQTTLLGEAIDQGPLAIFVADDDMRYLAVNAYACELLGYTREELLALTVLDVAINSDAQEDFQDMLRARSQAGTATLRRKDGTEFRARYRASETSVGGMTLYVSALWPDE
jgi:PAS domain S-box-containing protein